MSQLIPSIFTGKPGSADAHYATFKLGASPEPLGPVAGVIEASGGVSAILEKE